ncbi:bifunctional folylpolyglutamate synthase/dihydrofolate synthase [Altererythrobacter aquiaggeris]|uniref:bifunctional folylpolyglutamate synthase/dihydrofolate synthase n=1 Tax=Aestuarierythrobacter aquiaggeris TaxID=1898396 RepID=UPI003017E25B
MKDFAISDDPAVQLQLDRLGALSLPDGRLGLETIRALLARLGNPHNSLPPVFHVAGTNGKGSTCALLKAMLEAEGLLVHAATSPHLVRYNERIRVAGNLIDDSVLATILAEVLDAGADLHPSFFEATIAASFLAFSRTPADACVIEVGLGGRFDATNVIGTPAVCGIAALGIDHERFLLAPEEGVPKDPMARIAFEKAGIAKRGTPLVTMAYDEAQHGAIADVAASAGAQLRDEGRWWNYDVADGGGIAYRDKDGTFTLPAPALPGDHQRANCALATAMIRHQSAVKVSLPAMRKGARRANWPARMQRLAPGAVTGTRQVWLDGGHNRNAGEAIAAHFHGRRIHLILGMIASKDPAALIAPLGDSIASLTVVPIDGQDFHPVRNFGPRARSAADVARAIAALPDDGLPVLIAGSLYLAGNVLKLTGELPD